MKLRDVGTANYIRNERAALVKLLNHLGRCGAKISVEGVSVLLPEDKARTVLLEMVDGLNDKLRSLGVEVDLDGGDE